jgi:hypothetical protein
MKRRNFLAVAGSLFGAGCSQSRSGRPDIYKEDLGVESENSTQFEFDFGGQDSSFDFENNRSKFNFDFNNSQANSNDAFDFSEGVHQESDPLPTPAETNKKATEAMAKARQYLLKAIQIYAGFGDAQVDMTAVTPQTDSFSQYRINSKIRRAKQLLLRAANNATEGQKPHISALEQVKIFLKHATRAEIALQTALSGYRASMEYLYDGDTTNFEAPQKRMDKAVSNAKSEVEFFKDKTDISSMQVIDSDARHLYMAKSAQFESLIEAFNHLDEGITNLSDGLEDLNKGVKDYLSRNYRDASFRFIPAITEFRGGKAKFSSVQGNGVLVSATESGLDFISVLYEIANDIQKSAEARVNHNNQKYTEYREQAITHLRSDDRTQYMSEINRIQW